jgi:lipoprotein-anchoring transpeptidase ErfK/SrfK
VERALQQGQAAEAQRLLEEELTKNPEAPWIDQVLFKLAQIYEQQEKFAEARLAYSAILDKFPASTLQSQAQSRLGAINVALFLSPTITESDVAYEVRSGDTLGQIASSNRTTVDLIKKANNLSNDIIRPKQRLKIPKGTFRIAVDKSQNEMLVTLNEQFFKSYPVATGKNNSSPVGSFKIINKIPNPVWYHEGAVVPADSPANILGTRWMGFDKPGFGIHGSVDPEGIGKQVTAGCVRMHNQDVEELFTLVPVGTEVSIAD